MSIQLEPRFTLAATGQEVTRIPLAQDEASAAEAAGADSGKPGTVITLHLTMPDPAIHTFELVALPSVAGSATYATAQGSVTSSSGPWTDLATTPLALTGSPGSVKTIYLRLLTHRWSPSLVNPDLQWSVRVRAVAAASITA